MADIELVIKVDEKLYDCAKELGSLSVRQVIDVEHAIKKGTPLPKGHGALKDADAICKDVISALGIRNENYLLEAEKGVYKRIKNAQTIIEADRDYT